MPTASGAAVRRAFEHGQELGLEVRTVPHPRELLGGETLTHRIKRVSVEDLLRREPVDIDTDAVAGYLKDMSVLVTGGGGSIGSELVRQILAVGPRLITVVDNHEEALWSIERELAERIAGKPGVSFEPVLADVRSPEAMNAVIGRARPEVVFHAAALMGAACDAPGAVSSFMCTRLMPGVLRARSRQGASRPSRILPRISSTAR